MSLTRLKYLMNEGTDAEVEAYLRQLGIGNGAPLIGAPIAWISSTQMPNEIMPSMKGMVFLKLNGQTFDKELYSDLAKCFPSGVLPELRGEFIRGFDDGRGVDVGRALLTNQNPQSGSLGFSLGTYAAALTPGSIVISDNLTVWGVTANGSTPTSIENTNGPGQGDIWVRPTDTRPRNISFMYIVRAK